MENILSFSSDYLEGAHPKILEKLVETNMLQSVGYGLDEYSDSAKEKIRKACEAPDADVYFLVGGTQTNATMIDCMLRPYEGVLAAVTGHISVHEAGAIEFGGHKVLTLNHINGKVSPHVIENYMKAYMADQNKEHMVMPGMVYLSQPTEYGTLYTLKELEDISGICKKYKLQLYVDGARLAYALGTKDNDVTLKDLARLCDVFYIGGTKCGALFGEAVVIPKHGYIPYIFT
ncbi:MAG: low specificity L-threonine aldolase, partial [Lachnospiraceae bacterium]|nr:low specificity L-threonine aldolase [Lachnospiraceae bacterium]